MAPSAPWGGPSGRGEDDGGIGPELRSLIETYVSYLSGCDACAIESLRAARAADADPSRLHLLSTWRRAPFRTYTDRERIALVWAEVVVVLGEAGVEESLRREASALFSPAELADLTRAVLTTRAYRRLTLERTGAVIPSRRRAGRRATSCRDRESCDMCAAS